MTISHTDDELILKCTVQNFVSERPKGYGFFVGPGKLLTCAHMILVSEDVTPSRSVCGLIRGRDGKTKAVMVVHIKNARKSFPKLANNQDNIQLSITHYKA